MSINGFGHWGRHGADGLGPDLAETLRLLRGAPPGVAESTLALLPCAARRDLAAHGLLDARADAGAKAADIHITPLGWQHISSA